MFSYGTNLPSWLKWRNTNCEPSRNSKFWKGTIKKVVALLSGREGPVVVFLFPFFSTFSLFSSALNNYSERVGSVFLKVRRHRNAGGTKRKTKEERNKNNDVTWRWRCRHLKSFIAAFFAFFLSYLRRCDGIVDNMYRLIKKKKHISEVSIFGRGKNGFVLALGSWRIARATSGSLTRGFWSPEISDCPSKRVVIVVTVVVVIVVVVVVQ